MTLDRLRDALMSEVFARVVCLVFACWLLIFWTGWQRAEARVDAANERAGRVERDLVRIETLCRSTPDGGGVCATGTFVVPTTTVKP